jgi:hypothetical protein
MDYNPYMQSSDSLDSTYTDNNGDYAFNVSQAKFYNIVAEKGSTSCLLDSIFVQADAQTIVDNDTLRQSGWLSGAIRLKPGDDSRQAVILVLGTNVYTVPSDTSGSFISPLLPRGSYILQIFTTLPGYVIFDTLVSVQSGAGTLVNVTLPSANAPSIAKLSATYDSATMFVSLSWPMPDTSKIVSLILYRNSKTGNDTMMVIDKFATSYTDDVVGWGGDSVSYQIAGIGKNYKEGYRTLAQPIIVCGEVYCVKEFDLSRITAGLTPMSSATIFSDQENGIFLVGEYGNRMIYKLDSNGIVQKEYYPVDQNQASSFSGCLQSDDEGHLYIQKSSGDTQMVIKFDADLNVIGQLPLDSGFGSVLAGRNGTIYAFNDASDSDGEVYTEIKEYDSAFAVLKKFRIMNCEFVNSIRFGDTIVAYDNQDPFIRFYDTAFTLLSVFKPDGAIQSAWGNPQFGNQSNFIAAPNGIFISVFPSLDPRKESGLLLFTDRNGKVLARIIVPALYGVSFDSRGNLYFLTYLYTAYEDAGFNNRIKTLFKYTMGPLLRKIGH